MIRDSISQAAVGQIARRCRQANSLGASGWEHVRCGGRAITRHLPAELIFDEQNWSHGIPGFAFLKRYARKCGDARLNQLSTFIQRPDHVHELAYIATLIWYLDSGGSRDFRITSRPDQLNRLAPSADFLLRDFRTGTQLSVEVTRIVIASEMTGAQPIKRLIAHYLDLAIEQARPKLPRGSYEVTIGEGSMRGQELESVVLSMVTLLLRAVRDIPPGGLSVLATGAFALTVSRCEDNDLNVFIRTSEEVAQDGCLREAVDSLDSEGPRPARRDPLKLHPDLREPMAAAFLDALRKLGGMRINETVLLLGMPYSICSSMMTVIEDAFRDEFAAYYSATIGRCYLLYQDDDRTQLRIRRAW